MPEKCPMCGAEIHDGTVACPGCGMDVARWRMETEIDMLRDAVCGWQKTQPELDRLRAENANLKAIVDRLPTTADGVDFSDGLEVWFYDTRMANTAQGWKSVSANDGNVLAKGVLRFSGYSWQIEKDPESVNDICKCKDGETVDRGLPYIFEGNMLRRWAICSTREAAEAAKEKE